MESNDDIVESYSPGGGVYEMTYVPSAIVPPAVVPSAVVPNEVVLQSVLDELVAPSLSTSSLPKPLPNKAKKGREILKNNKTLKNVWKNYTFYL